MPSLSADYRCLLGVVARFSLAVVYIYKNNKFMILDPKIITSRFLESFSSPRYL